MACLEGERLPFKTAADRRALVGVGIKYLRKCDIDRTGRGYFFPRVAVVVGTAGRNLELDNGDWVVSGDLIEVVRLEGGK